MTLSRSLLFFGAPGVLIVLGLYLIVPIASAAGVPLIVSWTIALWWPVVGMLIWVTAKTDPPTRTGWRSTFRLRTLRRKDWIVISLAFIVVQICEILFVQTVPAMLQAAPVAPPSIIPELFDPTSDITAGLTTFFDVPVRGNWWLVIFWLGWLVVNIGGEELLWRGYALPLQEKALGRYAWLVNGLCWNLLIHAFMFWNFIVLMPISLLIPYLVQRYQNTWIGIWIHGLGNLMVLVILIPSIAGWL